MGHKTQNTKQNTKHKTQSLKIVETHQQCMMISNTMKVVTVAFCIVTPILGANPIIQRIMREEARATHGRRLIAEIWEELSNKPKKWETPERPHYAFPQSRVTSEVESQFPGLKKFLKKHGHRDGDFATGEWKFKYCKRSKLNTFFKLKEHKAELKNHGKDPLPGRIISYVYKEKHN